MKGYKGNQQPSENLNLEKTAKKTRGKKTLELDE